MVAARGRALPWALLVMGSVASLAANISGGRADLAGRLIAAGPSSLLLLHGSC
jgi:hypothetical protein